LPNLTIDRQQILRKYKYLNRPNCPRKECLYASENVQSEGWIIRYFHNESIPEYQPQKIKIDVDGELEKFAWQKSTDIMRKKDEISLYIKNALRIAIKENDIIADSSNEMEWSKYLILPRYFSSWCIQSSKIYIANLRTSSRKNASFY